jgi:hypothetical protein
MKLMLLGAGVMLAGLVFLLAMTARMVEPGLAQALVGYATAMGGMLIGVAGAVSLPRHHR